MFSRRIRIFRALIIISFLVLAVALFYYQVLRFRYYQGLSLKNTIRLIPIEAARGGIYDRNRKPLAVDELSFDLAVIPQEIKDLQQTLGELGEISGITKKELLENYQKNYHLPFVPVRIAVNLDKKRAFYIEEKLSSIPGALIWSSPRRRYPNLKTGSHLTGYVGRIGEEEFARLKDYGYKIQDLLGKSGIEKYYDAYLKGEDGGIQIEVDANSREVRRLGFKQPHQGKDLQLSIDLGLQRFVDKLFEERTGSGIIMDTKTGQILALVSSPEFDPNIFTSGTDRERLRLLNDKSSPILNRAIACAYPPGSTFKIVVAAAGVATGCAKQNTSFVCKGTFELGARRFNCWKESGHGRQNLIEGLTHSCNIFFYNLGRALGAEQLSRYAQKFGFGSLTGIDLPDETRGLVPGPLWKRLAVKEPWYEGDTINYSIGQGFLLVTPIQMLKAVTIIANEGQAPSPYLVEKIGDKLVSGGRPFPLRLEEKVFTTVKKGMFNVVNDPSGTGQYAKAKDIQIAGKTGTAQPGTPGDTHAWFCGYLPADNPKISFVIFLEHGGQGGVDPAHMTRIIATYLKENGFLG